MVIKYPVYTCVFFTGVFDRTQCGIGSLEKQFLKHLVPMKQNINKNEDTAACILSNWKFGFFILRSVMFGWTVRHSVVTMKSGTLEMNIIADTYIKRKVRLVFQWSAANRQLVFVPPSDRIKEPLQFLNVGPRINAQIQQGRCDSSCPHSARVHTHCYQDKLDVPTQLEK